MDVDQVGCLFLFAGTVGGEIALCAGCAGGRAEPIPMLMLALYG